MSRPMILGIDGGGTSTTAWIADARGIVLGRGGAGPSNIKSIGPEAARSALDRAIRSAFDDRGLEPRSVEIACLGLAGFDRPEDKRRLEEWSAESSWSDRLLLVNDGDLVVAAGTAEGWGVGLIAGTGSIAVGRDRVGRTSRAGGWGHLFGDEGSGYAVALAGLRMIARRADGRSDPGSPELADRICERLGIRSTSELISAVYREGIDRARIASLAPAVVEASVDDPSIVEEILEPAGKELARMVVAAARGIEVESGLLPLAMAGSFLLNNPIMIGVILGQLGSRGYLVESRSVTDPVEGALVLARRALG